MASRKEQREEARRQREEREAEERKKARRKRRLWQVGAPLVVAIAVIVIVVLISSSGSSSDQKVSKKDERAVTDRFAGIAQDGITLGNPEAKVTIYEFADLQCPFCRDAALGSLPTIVNDYVKSGRVRVEFRNFSILGPDSDRAARAVQGAADQGKAFQFIDLWYRNQGEENTGYVTDEFIRRIAVGARVPNPDAVVEASNNPEKTESMTLAERDADEFGIDGTPAYLLGQTGEQLQILQVQNPNDPNLFAQSIDRLLAGQE